MHVCYQATSMYPLLALYSGMEANIPFPVVPPFMLYDDLPVHTHQQQGLAIFVSRVPTSPCADMWQYPGVFACCVFSCLDALGPLLGDALANTGSDLNKVTYKALRTLMDQDQQQAAGECMCSRCAVDDKSSGETGSSVFLVHSLG